MSFDTETIGACGASLVGGAVIPTLLLIISEVMPFLNNKEKNNGIIHIGLCLMKKIINKEWGCSSEEVSETIDIVSDIISHTVSTVSTDEEAEDTDEPDIETGLAVDTSV